MAARESVVSSTDDDNEDEEEEDAVGDVGDVAAASLVVAAVEVVLDVALTPPPLECLTSDMASADKAIVDSVVCDSSNNISRSE